MAAIATFGDAILRPSSSIAPASLNLIAIGDPMPNSHVNGLVRLLGLGAQRRPIKPPPWTEADLAEADARVAAKVAEIIADMRAGTYSAGSEYLSAQRLRGTTQDATTANGTAR